MTQVSEGKRLFISSHDIRNLGVIRPQLSSCAGPHLATSRIGCIFDSESQPTPYPLFLSLAIVPHTFLLDLD
jgi:hypothetical protein